MFVRRTGLALLAVLLFFSGVVYDQTQTRAVTGAVITPTATPIEGFLPIVLKALPTPSPTPIPTATPVPANVRLTHIEYNPPNADALGEFVELVNAGGVAQDMTGWQLHDQGAIHVYDFPPFVLPPGATVRVWVRAGIDNAAYLYWGLGSAVWNNNGDTAHLRNNTGQLIDACGYAGGGQFHVCP